MESLEPRRLLASISGLVYADSDVNGALTPGEAHLEGWTIFADLNKNNRVDPGEPNTKTDADGRYTLAGLAAGNYQLRELVKTAYKPITPGSGVYGPVILGANEDSTGHDFGNKPLFGRDFVNFDANTSAASSILPPESSGAEGFGQFVSLNSSFMVIQARGNAIKKFQSLEYFFAPLSPGPTISEPKILFDRDAEKYIVVALDTSGGNTRILVAGSRGYDAKGKWNYHAIDISQEIGSAATASNIGIAIGERTFYITADIQGGTIGSASRLWIIRKGSVFNRVKPLDITQYDPSTLSGLPGQALGLRPAHMMGNRPDGIGTYLISFGALNGPSSNTLSVIQVAKPLNTPEFRAQILDLGLITSASTPPPAAQLGSGVTIATGNSSLGNALWRRDNLFSAATIVPVTGPDAGQATVHWFRIDTLDFDFLNVDDQGDIGGEDIAAGTSTFAPAIMADRDLFMTVGFSASGPGIHPGAYASGRLATDAPGTTRAAFDIAPGQDVYVSTISGGSSPWATYSGIILDTIDENRFWILNAFALPPDPLTGGQWGQRWMSFTQPAKIFPLTE